jgi:hypothetical protein
MSNPTPPLPRSILIIGRRWFQRTYGNTYCTAEIHVDGCLVHKTPRQYGYGDFYRQAAEDWLDSSGLVPPRPRSTRNNIAAPGWQVWRDELGIDYQSYALDVQRQRDL